MNPNKLAVISDVHGNTWALKQVLSDIKKKGIETIINLGDSLNGPLDPLGTFNLLTDSNIVSICGNGDRLILESLNSKSTNQTEEYVKSQINDQIIEWLQNLPFETIINGIYCCHASPRDDMEYLLETLNPGYISIKEDDEIESIIKNIEQKIIVCGHSHVPGIVNALGKTIHNVGSVGLPAYDDELPIPHKMETFSHHARYSILSLSGEHLNIEQCAVSYDYESAAKKAEENNRMDWANCIRTGRA